MRDMTEILQGVDSEKQEVPLAFMYLHGGAVPPPAAIVAAPNFIVLNA